MVITLYYYKSFLEIIFIVSKKFLGVINLIYLENFFLFNINLGVGMQESYHQTLRV